MSTAAPAAVDPSSSSPTRTQGSALPPLSLPRLPFSHAAYSLSPLLVLHPEQSAADEGQRAVRPSLDPAWIDLLHSKERHPLPVPSEAEDEDEQKQSPPHPPPTEEREDAAQRRRKRPQRGEAVEVTAAASAMVGPLHALGRSRARGGASSKVSVRGRLSGGPLPLPLCPPAPPPVQPSSPPATAPLPSSSVAASSAALRYNRRAVVASGLHRAKAFIRNKGSGVRHQPQRQQRQQRETQERENSHPQPPVEQPSSADSLSSPFGPPTALKTETEDGDGAGTEYDGEQEPRSAGSEVPPPLPASPNVSPTKRRRSARLRQADSGGGE